jgi:hypothetical protein
MGKSILQPEKRTLVLRAQWERVAVEGRDAFIVPPNV